VFDYHLDPDTVEGFSAERLVSYAKMAADLNKERSAS
jgi:hypothetical protein